MTYSNCNCSHITAKRTEVSIGNITPMPMQGLGLGTSYINIDLDRNLLLVLCNDYQKTS